ncbi:MAG TPA: NAD-dependent epimerase/dehydratase family protein [Actinomycetota bacterium]|nr:NAD-dependent epimerase/dehydratase family protein [Actinomycetota bacterium]
MRVLILGGDGYLGWPTAMRFSSQGHDVYLLDNYLRRRAVREAGSDSLTPIPDDLSTRAEIWKAVSGKEIRVAEGDVADWDTLSTVFREAQPETIVHYGQIPSAPYSMVDREHAVFTQYNNVIGNLNVIFAMRDIAPESHLIKLGTMGEYGTPNIDIEEGYIEIEHNGRSDVLPYPKLPGSLYHASKVHDSTNIHFSCRVWGLRATDLNQGVVYGIETEETKLDERLITRFDYDEIWGTTLNRFCLQAVIGHPLTVYGAGGQTRGFLNIVDTLQCIELAASNPAAAGEYRVFNQFTEQFSVAELAELVARAGREVGLDVKIDSIENPRVEAEHHYYNAKHTKLLDLGLNPHHLSETLIESMFEVMRRYQDRVITDRILPRVRWAPKAAAEPAPPTTTA